MSVVTEKRYKVALLLVVTMAVVVWTSLELKLVKVKAWVAENAAGSAIWLNPDDTQWMKSPANWFGHSIPVTSFMCPPREVDAGR